MIKKLQNFAIALGMAVEKYVDLMYSEIWTPCSTSMGNPKNNTLFWFFRSISINFVPFASDGRKQCNPEQSSEEEQLDLACSTTERAFKHEYCGNSIGLSPFSKYSKHIFDAVSLLQHSTMLCCCRAVDQSHIS